MNEAFNNGYNIGYAKAHEEWKAEAESVTLLLKEVAKLKAEREAAVADARLYSTCGICKHINSGKCGKCFYDIEWEWRGLSLVSVSSDKEEKHE